MGLFSRKPKEAPAASTPTTPVATTTGVDLGKKSGAISLTKGSRVTIEKTPLITATCSWSSRTDYDLYALVVMKDGTQKYVSTFGSQNDPNPVMNIGSVKHLGDITSGAGGDATEIIEIRMAPDVAAVIPIAYSAQSNGTGSFKKYNVSLAIDNHSGTSVSIDAKNANSNSTIYTVAVGIIWNDDNGIRIEALEEYSAPGSEKRPVFKDGKIVMDRGSTNLYK